MVNLKFVFRTRGTKDFIFKDIETEQQGKEKDLQTTFILHKERLSSKVNQLQIIYFHSCCSHLVNSTSKPLQWIVFDLSWSPLN